MQKISYLTNYFDSYAENLPFYVKTTGIHRSKKGKIYKNDRLFSHEVVLCWVISGRGKVWIDGREMILGKDQIVLCYPQEGMNDMALSEEWEYRWLSLAGSLAVAVVMSYGFPRFISSYTPYPEKLFERLESFCHVKSLFAQRRASAVVLDILAHADGYSIGHSPMENVVVKADEYIKSHLSDPLLSVEVLAEYLKVSKTTLTSVYHAHHLPSPGRRILDLRLIRARELILGTDLPVSEMCRLCGYSDPHTFTRFIKRACGMPPLQFRKRSAELEGDA